MRETQPNDREGPPSQKGPETMPPWASRRLHVIEGIGDMNAEMMKNAGVKTTESLLKRGSTPQGREALAEETRIPGGLILEWVNRADLFRIKGVGEEYSDLLEQAGVDTVPELAQRNAKNLHGQLQEVNVEKRVVRRLPSASQVEDWIEQAKQLPRVITY